MATLLITILPSLLIVAFFVKSDRFPEPTSEIIKIFMFGIFLCIPAFYINTALDEIYSNTNISEALIRSFLSAAPVEEVLKFISKGDDYQILFTSPKTKRKYIKNLSKRINIKITQIGNTTNVKNQRTIIDGKNQLKSINYRGYSHKF